MLPLFALLRRIAENFFSLSILSSSKNLFILVDFNCHHPFLDSKGTSDPHRQEIFNWVISSDLLLLNDPDIPTLLHRSFSDISFSPSSLALSCSWGMLQDLASDYQPILLAIPLSPVFCHNKRSPSLIFQKAQWNDFAMYFDSHRLLQKNTRLFLFFLLLLLSLLL